MALSSFSVSAKGLDGIPYRVDVNGGGTAVTGGQQFLVIEGGEEQDKGLDPIWPKRLRLFMREDVDLSPLFGQADRAVGVEVYDVTGGADTLVYRGFMVTDFYNDAPFEPKPLIELQALDGLGTLENDSLSALYSGGTEVSVQDGITSILSMLYPMEVEIGTEWYPGGSLTSNDNPLANVSFATDNYREERPDGEEFQSQLSVLRDLCIGQGLVIKQIERPSGARWLVAQRSAYNPDGTLKVWTYDTSGSLKSGEPSTRDRSLTLDVNGRDLLANHTREFVRRRQTVEVIHDHVDLEQTIEEKGFEDDGQDWFLEDDNDVNASVIRHDDTDISPGVEITPSPTSQNQKVLEVRGNTDTKKRRVAAEQVIGDVKSVVKGQHFRLSYETNVLQSIANGVRLKAIINATDYYTRVKKAPLRIENALPGEQVLPVEEITSPIPRGTAVPIIDSSESENKITDITLSERAEIGDDVLRGELASKIDYGTAEAVYVEWSRNSVGRLPTTSFSNVGQFSELWKTVEIRIPAITNDEETVRGQITFQIYPLIDTQVGAFYDNIELGIYDTGGSVDQSITEGSVAQSGGEESQTIRTSSGPTTVNLARLRADGFEPSDWGIGAGGGSLSLAELKARERLRYWRNHSEMWSVTGVDRDGTTQLTGDELVTLDGQTYTVHSIKYDAAKGETELTLIEYEDRGTSGITLETVLEQSEGASGGTSGGGGAIGGGGTIQSWDAITGKPFTDIGDGLAVSSDALEVAPSDFAGNALEISGGDLAVDIGSVVQGLAGDGLEQDGEKLAVDSTVARTDRDETFTGSVTIQKDLTVNGDEFIANTETVEATDNLIFLNAGETGSGITNGGAGFEADRGTEEPVRLIFDETEDNGRIGIQYRELTYSGLSGSFQLHETVVGSSSGAEGIVWADTGSVLRIKGRTGTFDPANDTLTGQSSGASAALDSVSTTDETQALATREDSPTAAGVPFWNATANRFNTTADLVWDGTTLSALGSDEDIPFRVQDKGDGRNKFEVRLNNTDVTFARGITLRGWNGQDVIRQRAGDNITQIVAANRIELRDGDSLSVFVKGGKTGVGGEDAPKQALDVAGAIRAQNQMLASRYRAESGYTSGFGGSGFALDQTLGGKPDAMELSHLSVRRTLRVRELLLEQLRVTNGTQIVSPGGGKVASVASSSHASLPNTFTSGTRQEWSFEDPGDTSTAHGMAAGDRVLAQRFNPDSQQVVTQIRAVVDSVQDTHTALVTVDDSYTTPNTGEETEGYEFAVVGSSKTGRDSLILDDPFGPDRLVLDGISDFKNWENLGQFARLSHGNLDGSYGYTSETYGLAAGDASGDHLTVDPSGGVRLIDGQTGTVTAQLSGQVFSVGPDKDLKYDAATDTLKAAGWTLNNDRMTKPLSDEVMQFGAFTFTGKEGFALYNSTTNTVAALGSNTQGGVSLFVEDGFGNRNNLVVVGDQHFRSEMGITIVADGDDILDTKTSKAFTDSSGTSYAAKIDSLLIDGNAGIEGDAVVDGTLTAPKISAGAIGTDEITIADALTLQPGGAFFAGQGDTRFAFGDFGLSQQEKGAQNHDGLSAGAFASEGGSDTVSNSRTRSVSLDTADQWSMVARADYSTSTNGNASATASVKVIGRVNGTVVGQNVSSASTGSGRLEVIGTLDLSAYSGTVTVDVEVVVEGSASTTDGSGFDSASADVGDFGNDANDPTSNVISNTDFFGTNGARWRKNGNDEIILNGRVFGGPRGTDAGDIWISGELNAASVNDRSSDRRLKTDIQPIEDPIETVRQMEGKTFQYRGNESAGLIAQDAIGVFDEAVSTYRKDGEEYYALDQRAFVAPVIESIKTLDSVQRYHEDRIQKLEEENERLRTRINEISA